MPHSRVPSWFASSKYQDPDTLPAPLAAKLDTYASGGPRPVAHAFVDETHHSNGSSLKLVLTLVGFFAVALWTAFHQASSPPRALPTSCNPFSKSGALFLNMENTSDTVWTPFDTSCPASHLLPLVENILESDAM